MLQSDSEGGVLECIIEHGFNVFGPISSAVQLHNVENKTV